MLRAIILPSTFVASGFMPSALVICAIVEGIKADLAGHGRGLLYCYTVPPFLATPELFPELENTNF